MVQQLVFEKKNNAKYANLKTRNKSKSLHKLLITGNRIWIKAKLKDILNANLNVSSES